MKTKNIKNGVHLQKKLLSCFFVILFSFLLNLNIAFAQANPVTITIENPTNNLYHYTSTGADLCSVPDNSTAPPSGYLTPTPDHTTIYTITCGIGYAGAHGYPGSVTASKSFTVEVNNISIANIETGKADPIKDTSAKLWGKMNPRSTTSHLTTNAYFRFSAISPIGQTPVFCNDIYGSEMKASNSIEVWGDTDQEFSIVVTNLTPKTEYFYCLVGSSTKDLSYGKVKSFMTAATASDDPNAEEGVWARTKNATVVDGGSAWLKGAYNTDVPAHTWFEYRKKDLTGTGGVEGEGNPYSWSGKINETAQDISTPSGNLKFLATGLFRNTEYEYHAVIQNDLTSVVSYGDIYSFKTKSTGGQDPFDDNLADLIAEKATPSTSTTNAPTTLTALIKNKGNKSTSIGFSNFFQISTTNPGIENITAPPAPPTALNNFLGTPKAYAANLNNPNIKGIISTNLPPVAMSALAKGASSTTSQTYTFEKEGNYYIRACADKKSPIDAGVVRELSEKNNCGPWAKILITTMTQLPDLVALPPTQTTATVGESTPLSSEIKNQGESSTIVEINVLFQVSSKNPNITPGPGQTPPPAAFNNLLEIPKAYAAATATPPTVKDGITNLAYVTIPALGIGESGTATKNYTFGPSGTYYIRACADKKSGMDKGVIVESIEGNNCSSPWREIVVSPPAEDLCPDVTGVQTTLPCPPAEDLCPDVTGVQTTLPCPPAEDLCPDVTGVQTTLPCPPAEDLCPNDPGIQKELPCPGAKMPDVVALPTTPVVATVGIPFNINSIIKNQGNKTTGINFKNFFQITETDPNTPNALVKDLASVLTSKMNAGASRTIKIRYTIPTFGTHYTRACADQSDKTGSGVITESNEGNNCGTWTTVNLLAPDLTAFAPTLKTTTVDMNARVTLSAEIKNTGDGSTVPRFNNFFQVANTDANIVGGSVVDLEPTSMSKLDAGKSKITKKVYAFPKAGTFLVRICANKSSSSNLVDPLVIVESNKENNCSPWTTVTVLPLLPDLVALPPTRTIDKDGVTVTLTSIVKNMGNAATTTKFYTLFQKSNTDPTITTEKSKIESLTPVLLQRLNAGKNKPAVKVHTFPSAGIYYVRACADQKAGPKLGASSATIINKAETADSADQKKGLKLDASATIINELETPESNEENNCSPWTKISLMVPDLIATAPAPSKAEIGVPITLSSTIKNQGNGSTGTSFNNIFLVSDKDPGQGNTSFTNLPPIVMSELKIGEKKLLTQKYTFTSPGTFYIGACADKINSSNSNNPLDVVESDEANNCGPWTKILVSAPPRPDLIALIPTAPTNAEIGNPISLSAMIKNQGNASTETAFNNIFLVSETDQIIPNDLAEKLSPVKLNALDVGKSDKITKDYTFTSAGTFYIGACANKINSSNAVNPLSVIESDETNNCGPWTKVIVTAPPLPDLTALPPVVSTTVTALISTTLTSTITNSGNLSTGANFDNFFQVSDTNPATPGGLIEDLTSTNMTKLEVGNTETTSKDYIFKTPGTFYTRACADKKSSANTGVIKESQENNNCSSWTTLTVLPGIGVPIVTLTANPTTGNANTINPTLTWTATNNPVACTASGDWSGSKATSGSQSIGILNTAKIYTYSIVCSNIAGNSATATATVTVVAVATPINGACAPDHFNCTTGTSTLNVTNANNWTWKCEGSNAGTDSSCSETKPIVLPDLIAQASTPTTSSTKSVALSAVIKNEGGSSTVTSFHNFFQVASSNPDVPTGGPIPVDLTSVQMNALGAGETGTTTKNYTFPNNGTYWTRACADKFASINPVDVITINESNENNNCAPWTAIVINEVNNTPTPISGACAPDHFNCTAGTSTLNVTNANNWTWLCNGTNGGADATCLENKNTPSLPDLIAMPSTPTTSNTKTVALSALIKNEGGSSTADSVFYNFFQVADSDPNAPSPLGIPIDLTATPMGTVAAKGSLETTKNYTFPNNGTYWTRACADKANSGNLGTVTESNEVNNCAPWTAITINEQSTLPDLIAMPSTPTSINTKNATLSAVIKNEGGSATAESVFYNFFQVANSNPDGGNALIIDLASTPMGTIPGKGNNTTTKNYTFPTVGTYYVRACADKSNKGDAGLVEESNETNNCAPWTMTVISPA